MKKLTLILMMVLGSVLVRAQHCDSIDNHMAGWYNMTPSGIILLGNGDLLCSCLLVDLDENGHFVYDENQQLVGVRGYQYYWITNDGLSVSDSLFIPGDDQSARLWTRPAALYRLQPRPLSAEFYTEVELLHPPGQAVRPVQP